MVDQPRELSAIAVILGSALVSFEPIPWGDARATWRLDLVDGRRVVARAFLREPAPLLNGRSR